MDAVVTPTLADDTARHADGGSRLRRVLHDVAGWADRHVGFSEAAVMAFDPEVLLPVAFATTRPWSAQRFLAACRIEQMVADVAKFRDLAVGPTTVAVLSRDDALTRTSPRWIELNEPEGHRHELRAVLVDRRHRCWGALSLLRTDLRPFSPSNAALVAAHSGSLADGIAKALVMGEQHEPAVGAGTLWLDAQGEITHSTPSAEHWLDELARAHPEYPRTALVSGISFRLLGQPDLLNASMRARTRSGWVTLHAERVTTRGQDDTPVAVVIDEAHPTRVLPIAMAAFDLTPREAEVTSWVLQGRDTRAISGGLRISEYTVQDHLKSIFAKVGVASRGELAHALIRPLA